MIGLVLLFLLAVPVGLAIALVWIAVLRRRVDALEQRLVQWQSSGAGARTADAAALHQPAPTNVPVKVCMLVLLAGVASLLKYASDQGWMRMPVELRLAGISVLALAGLVFGWKQRLQRQGVALAL